MESIEIWKLVLTILFSGVAGALTKQFFDSERNKTQSILYWVDLRPFFNTGNTQLINSKITINENGEEYKFENLYFGTFTIINSGITDYSNFLFGLTLNENYRFIQVHFKMSDRHHVIELSEIPTLRNPIESFDITLNPFNRKDSYTFDIIIESSIPTIEDNSMKVSTPKPVILFNLNTAKAPLTRIVDFFMEKASSKK